MGSEEEKKDTGKAPLRGEISSQPAVAEKSENAAKDSLQSNNAIFEDESDNKKLGLTTLSSNTMARRNNVVNGIKATRSSTPEASSQKKDRDNIEYGGSAEEEEGEKDSSEAMVEPTFLRRETTMEQTSQPGAFSVVSDVEEATPADAPRQQHSNLSQEPQQQQPTEITTAYLVDDEPSRQTSTELHERLQDLTRSVQQLTKHRNNSNNMREPAVVIGEIMQDPELAGSDTVPSSALGLSSHPSAKSTATTTDASTHQLSLVEDVLRQDREQRQQERAERAERRTQIRKRRKQQERRRRCRWYFLCFVFAVLSGLGVYFYLKTDHADQVLGKSSVVDSEGGENDGTNAFPPGVPTPAPVVEGGADANTAMTPETAEGEPNNDTTTSDPAVGTTTTTSSTTTNNNSTTTTTTTTTTTSTTSTDSLLGTNPYIPVVLAGGFSIGVFFLIQACGWFAKSKDVDFEDDRLEEDNDANV